MDKKNKIITNIGLIIFELILMYMATGNIIYLVTQMNESFFGIFDLIVGILDIILVLYLLVSNTKCILNINKKAKKNKLKINSKLMAISNFSTYIYFCGILYRMQSYILYLLATIAMVLVVSNYKKFIDYKNIKIKSTKKIILIKLVLVVIILAAILFEFWQFTNITNTLNDITKFENANSMSVDDNYNIKILYQNQKNNVFIKYIICIITMFTVLLSIITNNVYITKISKISVGILLIISIVFLANNNVLFAYIQMASIYLVYPQIVNIKNKRA